MTASTYNTISAVLGIGVLLALAVLVVSLVAMIAGWRTPKRRGHLIRLLIAMAAIPLLIGVQQAVLWLVYLPELGRQQRAEFNEAREEQFEETTLVKVGDTVPACSVTTIDGDTIALPQPGKVVLINFFATWCGPCQLELPHLERLWSELKDDERFRLVVVGREETDETVRNYRRQYDYTFPMAADTNRDV